MILFDIERTSYVDGPGIRTTVFFKGCNLKCVWCHNPESQSFKKEIMFYKNKCIGCGKCLEKCKFGGIKDVNKCTACGKCAMFCPKDARKVCGKEYSADEVLKEILKDKPFYKSSGGGVTFSGGECMLQPADLLDLLKKCKKENIHTAVDTAGNVPFSVFESIFEYTDLFLYDIKAYDPDVHKSLTGVDNSLILENYKKLIKQSKKVWVRIPLIIGANEGEMKHISEFLKKYPPEKTELLPYHAMGEAKYDALNMKKTVFSAPTDKETADYRKLFI